MMIVNPYVFGATLSTVVDYQFNGTDGATSTTDSTGNTTASGLGVVSGSSFAYIFNNKLFARNNYTTIDNSGALSGYLTFESDFEILIAASYNDWPFFFGATLFVLENASQLVFGLDVFKDGHFTTLSNTGNPILAGTGIDMSSEQIIKITRVGTLLSVYIDGVLKASTNTASDFTAGRFKFWTSNFERYVDYLRIKKV